MKATCTASDCEEPARARGLCLSHYGRALRANEIVPKPRTRVPPADVDTDSKTCTCSVHGPGAPLRARVREGGSTYFTCHRCDRGDGSRSRRRQTPAERRASKLWAQYGISVAEFEIRSAAQDGKCLICREGVELLYVDHDHATGVIRGLLCHPCNIGLGWFRDDPARLRQAIKYLRRAS